MFRISHEVPRGLLQHSLIFNDYDYFLVHQIQKYTEYSEFFRVSKTLKRTQILDNSAYELKESFDPDIFMETVRELEPSEYVIPDCFNDSDRNLEMFDDWMSKDSNEGIKIAVLHGKSVDDFMRAYRHFDRYENVKIAFNFAENFYSEIGEGNRSLGRERVIRELLNAGVINTSRKHHLLGCYSVYDFLPYTDMAFIDTIDTSNPVVSALENLPYPRYEKPKTCVDDYQDSEITAGVMGRTMAYTRTFRDVLGGSHGS